MKKKFLGSSVVATIGLLVLTACGTNDDQTISNNETTKDTFTYAISGDPTSLNPINVSDRWGLTATNMIYSPLVRVEEDGSLKYELADSMETTDGGKSVTVHLKENVKWSDGEAFTADDVVFTYENKVLKENGNADALWIGDEPVKTEKVDEHTVKFNFPKVSAAAANNIATETYIMPEHLYEGQEEIDFSGAELADGNEVGTGPYVLSEYKRGEYLQFKANPNYYGGEVGVKNVTLRIITNADTTKVALQKGEVDASMVLPSDIEDLKNNNLNTFSYSENRVGYMGLNLNSDKLSDQKVRQAIFFALNKEDMNKAAYLSEEFYNTPNTILPPNNPFATTNVETYAQNVEKSKQLLSEAGVTDLTINLAYGSDNPEQTLQATLIQQQLQAVGINVELAGGDAAAIFTELRNPGSTKYDMFLGGYIMGNDPDLYASLYKSGAGANYFNYASEKADALFEQGAVELDENKRKEIYAELQATINEDAIVYPIVDNKKILAASKNIQGIEEARLVPIYSFEDLSKISLK
ncbi:ABC transporter substrate-binding protein [Vagococcus xieshaowenii]|uniref:ABC transporter substrate-binding protein n=1 Tax=Vagococcus xieshaowenii TaxID=2562451 RepID=A0A4Z0D8L8_9ENTE|nr:ABC transporter substrate-binding protein [Vagococcus xieshaowenii]QCA28005.1 ABC transporter substrate-binding protein [Vagococcus xieshaowenii]TFZ41228.1 ABC transporter substrate-binding protein [Vagococcus xieshaowenii]